MMFKKTLTAAFIAGIASLPMQSAQAWWGGPGYGGSGSEWGPFDGDGWGDFNMSMSGGGGPYGYGGYPGYYGAPAAPATGEAK